MRQLGILLYLTCLHIIALLLFSNGFLLTRISLDDTTPAKPQQREASFSKAVILVIDALRYDFVTEQNDTSPYWNHFPILSSLAKSSPEQAFLTKFIADPPTTTLQRLKGLTTGSLPTFVDAGSNFAGDALTEDNLLYQLRAAGREIAFVGDDTWQALFPDTFVSSLNFPFESLNVWDLDTVDNGVYHHLLEGDEAFMRPNIRRHWDVAIAHALGLDHSGHRYGPDHQETTRKLRQMNEWIRELISTLDDDTLLVVMGDHGMNPQGDHGGDSAEELEAALFMYSQRGVFSRPSVSSEDSLGVAQIDFVPSLALLLGIPIPFNNLGSPIPELFQRNPHISLESAVQATSSQISSYIAKYSKHSTSILESLAAVHERFPGREKSTAWQKEVLAIFRRQWAQYHVPSILCGLFLMASTIMFHVVLYNAPQKGHTLACLAVIMSLEVSGMTWLIRDTLPQSYTYYASISAVFLFGLFTASGTYTSSKVLDYNKAPARSWTFVEIVPVFVLILHCLAFASNSFTVHEDRISLLLLSTLCILQLVYSNHIATKDRIRIRLWLDTIVIMILSRAASSIRLCREEQGAACLSNFYRSSAWQVSILHTFLTVALNFCIQYMTLITNHKNKINKHQSDHSWHAVCFTVWSTASALYWFLEKSNRLPSVTPTLARLIIIGPIGQVVFLCSAALPVTFRLENGLLKADGLYNILASSYLRLSLPLLSIFVFLGRSLGSLSVLVLVLQLVILCDLYSIGGLPRTGILVSMISAELGFLHFFSTGHQMGLPFIQWDLAFLVSRSITYPVSPLLITGNAFGSFLVVAIWLPVFVLWRKSSSPKDGSSTSDQTSAFPQDRSAQSGSQVIEGILGFMLVFACLTFSTMFFANHFRRHLMVWKIFAPRFMCASVILIITDLTFLLVCCGLVLCNQRIRSLGKLLQSHSIMQTN